MTRIWFTEELETVATFWRIYRKDGVALGFTTHDRDIWLEGVLHQSSPGMLPSSIRKSADLYADSAEVIGALSHEAIVPQDIQAGCYDDATIHIGLVDWESGEHHTLYSGTLSTVTQEGCQFSAELLSHKALLWKDTVPRTSPLCRSDFCAPGCNLNPAKYMFEATLIALNTNQNSIEISVPTPIAYPLEGGSIRWLEGPQYGSEMTMFGVEQLPDRVLSCRLNTPIHSDIAIGTKARVKAGCNHTIATCAGVFNNASNFRGEPHLPGNDMLTRYPSPQV